MIKKIILEMDLDAYKKQASIEKKAYEDEEEKFNSDFTKLARSKKINGNPFTYELDSEPGMGYAVKVNKAGTPFEVYFINDFRDGKAKRTIQVSTPVKRGVIEKTVSGKNATADAIWKKLDKFFSTTKW